ncbi:hypothetical protein CHARACLAT_032614 [Characodon lateralis]|uniref:Sushi domain-containing protein n=1 Tax=Characodon lateralis TaxID=208331 RepID=A0ABU7DW30_9TELE|nr:hypothetical protein [Characodon lateralis]
MEGSVMTYHCDPGKFPFPVSYRVCGADGDWSPLRLPSGRPVSRPICKDMLCPGQLQLDNGEFWPRNQWFQVGTTQSFSCQEGFSLYGSAQRNCTLSGEWTGAAPICDDHGEEMMQRFLQRAAVDADGCGQEGSSVALRLTADLKKPLTEDTLLSNHSLI